MPALGINRWSNCAFGWPEVCALRNRQRVPAYYQREDAYQRQREEDAYQQQLEQLDAYRRQREEYAYQRQLAQANAYQRQREEDAYHRQLELADARQRQRDLLDYQAQQRRNLEQASLAENQRIQILNRAKRLRKIRNRAAVRLQRWWRSQQKRLQLKNARLQPGAYAIHETEGHLRLPAHRILPDHLPHVLEYIK